MTFYGRRSSKLLESKRNYYLENYNFIPPSVKNGKLNLYMFFIEHGLEILKPEGQLIYLLDNSIYENSAYHIRKWMIENFQINSIQMGLTNFENVSSGQTLWHLTKSVPKKYVFIKDINREYCQNIMQKLWLKNDECRISFFDKNSILDQLLTYQKLVDYFPTCLVSTN